MKTVKLFFYSLLVTLVTLTSCTNNDSIIDDLPNPQESASMQTTIVELRAMFNEDGSIIEDQNPTGNLIFDLCFEFVYPIELIYNTGTTVTVNSNEELITVITNSTNELFIVGIEFPFDVEVYNSETNQIEIITINNEEEFANLIESCVFNDPCDCDNEDDPVCVEIEENGQTIIITFPNACLAECEGFTENQYFDCQDECDCPNDYNPVCVEVNGEIIQFDNYCLAECEGYTQQDMVDCENDGCDCDDEYDPVCVQTGDGIFEFINACYAECEGFTEDDFVDCENDSNCNISNLEVIVGECNPTGTYVLTIDFDYENVGDQEFFDLYLRNGELLGYYPLADLPFTIYDFELSGYDDDYIKVCINDNSDCCQEIEWSAPDCNGDGTDCYEFVFPITMFLNGETVTVNTNEDVDFYLGEGYQLSYPIDIIVNNETITVMQGILEGAYGDRCE